MKTNNSTQSVQGAIKELTSGGLSQFLYRTGLGHTCGECCPICSDDIFSIKVVEDDVVFRCKVCGTGNAFDLLRQSWDASKNETEKRIFKLIEEIHAGKVNANNRAFVEDIMDVAEAISSPPPPPPVPPRLSGPSIIEALLAKAAGSTNAAPSEKVASDIKLESASFPTGGQFVDLLQSPLPKVLLPGAGVLLSHFATNLANVLKDKDIFLNGNLVVVPNEKGHLIEVKPIEFRTDVEKHLICYALDPDKPNRPVFKTMSLSDAATVLASKPFMTTIREVRRVNSVRLPVLRQDGSIALLNPGYDPESQILTLDNAVSYSTQLGRDEAIAIIREVFSEFPFTDARSLSVSVAAMFSLYAHAILPEGCLRPCFITVANSEGSGKSLLTKLILFPVVGAHPIGAKSRSEDEIRKLLLATLMAGSPALLLDNLREHLESAALEAFITATIWQDRVLGKSLVFIGRNNVFVFITANNCSISNDMRRRSLFAELFNHADLSEDRKFRRRLEESDLQVLRPHLLAALWSLTRDWDLAGRPKPSKTHASFPEWTDIVAGIVEHAGFGCPVESPQFRTEVNSDVGEMRRLVEAMSNNRDYLELNFADITRLAKRLGLFERIIGGEGEDMDKKARTSFSTFLRRYDHRHIAGFLFRRSGVGHQRMYSVEKLPKTSEAS